MTSWVKPLSPTSGWNDPSPPATDWSKQINNFLSILGTEDGFAILQENGSYILLETSATEDTVWVKEDSGWLTPSPLISI
jgi:hypothetical protein